MESKRDEKCTKAKEVMQKGRNQSGSSGRGNVNKRGEQKGKERKRLEPGKKRKGVENKGN